MNPIQTGIGVALALVVVTLFLILPRVSLFGSSAPSAPTATSTPIEFNDQTTSPTMQSATDLQVTDEKIGTGQTAQPGDTVTVNYVGALTNGTVFDASANHGNQGFTFTLGAGQVIEGWDKGIAGMKVGGKRKLVIPASLAYGDRAIGDVIPANSTLIFEVELLSVSKGQ